MDCGMGTALGTAHLIAAFEEEQKVQYRKLKFLNLRKILNHLYINVLFDIYVFLHSHFHRQLYFLL